MALKHTPGPWHIGMKPGPMIYGTQGEQIADMRVILPRGELTGNARLISAAPDLLAALQSLLEVAGYLGIHESPYTDAASNARLAISKATGE